MLRVALYSYSYYICYCVAEIRLGDWVLDPFCGSGAILLESYHSQPNAIYIGSDITSSAMDEARQNRMYLEKYMSDSHAAYHSTVDLLTISGHGTLIPSLLA